MRYNFSTKLGIIGGLLIVASICAMIYLLKMPYTGGPQGIALSMYVGFVFFSVYHFSKNEKETQELKACFNQGFKTFIIMTLFIVVFTFFFYKFNTSFLEEGIVANTKIIREQGNHTEAEILVNNEKLRNIFMPMMLSITTLILLILGAISSIVAAALFKKNN